MNAGFSSLAALRRVLLPSTWQSVTSEDDSILALGLGVAGLFEGICARKFQRTVAGLEYHDATAGTVQLSRFPLETLTALDLQSSVGGTWDSVMDSLTRISYPAGILYFGESSATVGTLRATTTAGYWWDTTEDESGTLPSGATALPAAILTAWQIQCRAIYARTETDAMKAGLAAGNLSALSTLINEAQVLPVVSAMLSPYRILAA